LTHFLGKKKLFADDDSDEEFFTVKKTNTVLNQVESSRFNVIDMDGMSRVSHDDGDDYYYY
jgi:hypothetical protein